MAPDMQARLLNIEKQRKLELQAQKKFAYNKSTISTHGNVTATGGKPTSKRTTADKPQKPITFPLVQGDDYLDELLREMRQDAINEEYAVNVAKGNIEGASADNAGKLPKKEIKKTASQPLQKKSSKLDDQTNAIYQRLLDPDTLLDYNPQDGGMRIGLAGLAGLPLGDNAVYSVRA